MPRLIDLKPRWIDQGDRKGLGIEFGCMIGTHHDGKPCEIRNIALFANPLDGEPAWAGNSRSLIVLLYGEEERYNIRGCGDCKWKRTGDTFESLSCTPSFDMHQCGHLTLTNGVLG